MGKACADTYLQLNYTVTLKANRYCLNAQLKIRQQNNNTVSMEQLR